MTIICRSFNVDDIIRLRKTGISVNQIAKELSVPIFRVNLVLKDTDLLGFKHLKFSLNEKENEIIKDFNDGISCKKLASDYKTCRNVIYRILNNHSIIGRTRSQSAFIRMSNATFEEKRKNACAANEKMRNMGEIWHLSQSIKRAITRGISLSEIGDNEVFVFEQLKINGFQPIQQAPVSSYNIDILCGNTAIEIHKEGCHPHNRSLYRKRIINLLKCGLNIIYVKWSKKTDINTIAINKLMAFLKFSSINPSDCGKYWVIRGTGEVLFSGGMDRNNLSVIRTSDDIFNSHFRL